MPQRQFCYVDWLFYHVIWTTIESSVLDVINSSFPGPSIIGTFEKQASGSSLAVMLFPYTRNVFVCWGSKCSKHGTTCKCCDMWVWTLERCELFVGWFCFSIHVNSKDECAHDQISELPIRVTAPSTRQRSKWQLPLLMRNYCNSVSFVLFVCL